LFLSELGGCLDVYEDVFNDCLEEMFFQHAGRYPTEAEKEASDRKAYCKIIYNCFRLKKITTELPTFRIFPDLNAMARWNTDRKYRDGNDTLDFMHANAALPYFDYFFTERELKTMISQRGLDTLFNCQVESDPKKVLPILLVLEQQP
jgi:hypothetical protein